jgi:chaperonin cofactor prefoldin
MSLSVKKERRKQNKATDELREEVEMLDIRLSSLVDVLEGKRIVGHDEWEKRIRERLSSK